MKALYLLISLLMISCGGDDFEEQSKLSSLKVLAITADTPEINAAATVTLTPLISYVDGSGATLNYNWEACPDPGIDYGADLNCDSAVSGTKLNGTGAFNTSSISGTHYTGNATDISVAVPAAAFTYLASTTSDIQYNGVDYIVFLTYTDSTNSKSISAIKRIKLSTKAGGDLNTNPTIGSIQFNSSNLAAYPASEGTITLASPSAAQSYSLQTNIGLKSFSEKMYISWYSNTGEFLFNRTDIGENNTFTPEGTTGVFVAVYRDGRGGVVTTQVSF